MLYYSDKAGIVVIMLSLILSVSRKTLTDVDQMQ